MRLFLNLVILITILGVSSCVSQKQMEENVAKIIKNNPKILTDAIKAKPVEFMEALQAAAKDARGAMAKKKQDEEQKKLAESFDKPLVAKIRSDESIRGTKGAPLTLIEYSDFQCPFCSRAYTNTVKPILEKYKGKIQFVYKHLPLSFHDKAMIASQYYEAIRLQSAKKAFAFHDSLYNNQSKLQKGEKFLKSIAKKAGANMRRLAKDLNSSAVMNRIKEDQAEAQKFGMQGTPGFLLNGVPVRGAYPVSYFEGIIEKLKAKGKVNL